MPENEVLEAPVIETLPSGAPMIQPGSWSPPTPTAPVTPVVETVVTPPATETTPVVETPELFNFETYTGGKYKSLEDIAAIEAQAARAAELEARYNKPELNNWLEALADPDKFNQLAPIIADLNTNYKELDPIALVRKGWEEDKGKFVPSHRNKNEVFDEYLNSEFSVTDPEDRANGYGATGNGETELLKKADEYLQRFETRQSQNRTLAKETLQAKAPAESTVIELTPAQIQEQKAANLAAFQSFKPSLEGVSEVASPYLELAPPQEWLDTTAKQLSENPWSFMDRFFPQDEHGIYQPKMAQILNAVWILDNAASAVNSVAEKAFAGGKADGTTKVVETLRNPSDTPSLAVVTDGEVKRLPSGAPIPIRDPNKRG